MSPQIKLTTLVPGQHVSESVGYSLHRRLNESVNLCPPLPVWAEEPPSRDSPDYKELGLVGHFWELWGRLKCVSRGVGRRVGQHKGNEVIHAQL